MKNSFEHITNGWLYRTCKAVGDAIIISLLFALFCLPIVTIGPSVTALYYTVYRKYAKKTDNITKDFMHSLKDNLKQGIILNILYLVYSGLVGFNIYFAFFGIGNVRLPEWYPAVSLVPLIPLIFSLPFVYPLLARFDNTVKGTLKNSFTLCLMNFPKFLLIWIIIVIALAVCIVFPPAVLLVPTGAMYLTQFITEKVFTRAMNVKRSQDEDTSAENDDESDDESEEDDEGSAETEYDSEETDEEETEDEENG